MSSKAPELMAVVGVGSLIVVTVYFVRNPDQAGELLESAKQGVANAARKVIDNTAAWVENTVIQTAHDLVAPTGLLGPNDSPDSGTVRRPAR